MFPYAGIVQLKAKGSSQGRSVSSGFVAGEARPQAVTEFDFGALEPVMDEEDAQGAAAREALQRVLNAVCEWLYPARARKGTMVLRAYAFLWFLRPEWLGNPTQVELAERLEVSKQTLGKVINKWRRHFGFYVAGMRGDEAREKFREHARKQAGALAAARRKAVQVRVRR